jgi:alkylhydroperoxidase family enzyme
VLGTLANSPLVAKRLSVLLAGLLGKGCLSPREREIVILRMGWRCGSRYEFTGHIGIGRDAGLTDDEIESITMDPASSGLPIGDAALIRVVDELYDGNAVTQATWDLLAERWSSDQLVEIVVVAGIYWTISGFLNAMRVVPEDHWPGWPNGVGPTGRE